MVDEAEGAANPGFAPTDKFETCVFFMADRVGGGGRVREVERGNAPEGVWYWFPVLPRR